MANLFSDMNEWYQNNIGQPFVRSPIGQAVSGFFGVPPTDPNDPSEVYKAAQALGNLPGLNIPAGAGKGLIQALAHSPEIATAIFAGGRALQAPTKQLELAKKMYNEGRSYEDIYRNTAIHTQPGVPPQWEIVDKNMTFSPQLAKLWDSGNNATEFSGKLADIVTHKELLDNYPELTNTTVTFKKLPKGQKVSGSFDPSTGNITIAAEDMEWAKDALVHELDHAVQRIEFFPRGANPDALETGQKAEAMVTQLEVLKRKAEQELQTAIQNKREPYLIEGLQDRLNYLDKSQKTFEMLKRYPDTPQGRQRAYEDFYGEMSARNTSARRNMDFMQRLDKSPQQTQEIPQFFPILTDEYKGAYYGPYMSDEALPLTKPKPRFDPFGDTTE